MNFEKKSPCFRAGRNENKTECIRCKILTPVPNKAVVIWMHISTVPSVRTHAIQICHNTLKASEFVLHIIQKQNKGQ